MKQLHFDSIITLQHFLPFVFCFFPFVLLVFAISNFFDLLILKINSISTYIEPASTLLIS